MGYTTSFDGVLEFKNELTTSDLNYLNQFLGEDFRDHPDWVKTDKWSSDFTHLDLELAKDFSGVQWNGTEKTYYMVEMVNYLISVMREKNPDFNFEGEFIAQGEDPSDRWKLAINESGWAEQIDFPRIGEKLRCPNCEEVFVLDEDVERVDDEE